MPARCALCSPNTSHSLQSQPKPAGMGQFFPSLEALWFGMKISGKTRALGPVLDSQTRRQ